MTNFLITKPALRSCLVALVVVLLVVVVLPRSYQVNDDVGMTMLFQQNYHVPFVSSVFSRLMGVLYQWLPQMPVYGLYLYSMLFGGLWSVLYCIKQTEKTPVVMWVLIGVFSVLFIGFVSEVTFTYASILLAGMGLVLFVVVLNQKDNDGIVRFLPSSLMLLLSYLLRPNGLVGATLFLLPLLGYWLWQHCQLADKKEYKKLFACLAILVSPTLVAAAIDVSSVLLTPSEKKFQTYANTLSKVYSLQTFDEFSKQPEEINKLGWSVNDCGIFRLWLTYHEDKFSLDTVTKLNNTIKMPSFYFQAENIMGSFKKTAKLWLKYRELSFLLVILTVLAMARLKNRNDHVFLLGYLIYFFLGGVAMVHFLRFPARVCLGLFYIASVATHVFSCTAPSISLKDVMMRKTLYARVQWLAAFVLIVIAAVGMLNHVFKIPSKQSDFLDDVAYLQDVTKEGYVVRAPGLIYTRWSDPLTVNPLDKIELGPGWLLASQPIQKRLSSYGIYRYQDMWLEAIDNPQLYWLARDGVLPFVKQFYTETFQTSIEFELIGTLPTHPKAGVYRVIRSEHAY